MSIEPLLKIKTKQLEKTNYMSKKNSYIGISFIILIFGIYVIRNLDDRISNETLIDDNRLNKKNEAEQLANNKLFVYNKVPSFEFTNQDGNIVNNETYRRESICCRIFLYDLP